MENKKKRKEKGEEESDDDEEKKMDKFYSLLRSFREARDRRRKEIEELDQNKKKIRKTEEIANNSCSSPPSIWVPSFESGDFTNDVHFRKPPLIFPSTLSTTPPIDDKHKGNNKDQHQNDASTLNLNLNLNLAL